MEKQNFLNRLVYKNDDAVTKLFHYYGLNLTNYHSINIRQLYDFFDYNNIYVFVLPKINTDNTINFNIEIYYYNDGRNLLFFKKENINDSRINIEMQAFEAALNFLDDNLKT